MPYETVFKTANSVMLNNGMAEILFRFYVLKLQIWLMEASDMIQVIRASKAQ